MGRLGRLGRLGGGLGVNGWQEARLGRGLLVTIGDRARLVRGAVASPRIFETDPLVALRLADAGPVVLVEPYVQRANVVLLQELAQLHRGQPVTASTPGRPRRLGVLLEP